jgi:hypothetical protein
MAFHYPSNQKEARRTKKKPPRMPIVEELSTVKDPSGQILEAPLEPEAVRHPITAPSLPGATSTETMTRTPQPQVVRKGQTAVFTIQYQTRSATNLYK